MSHQKVDGTQGQYTLLAYAAIVWSGAILAMTGDGIVPAWVGAAIGGGGLLGAFLWMRRQGGLSGWIIAAFGAALAVAAVVGQMSAGA